MKFSIYIFLFALLGFTSCKKENLCDCVKSTGPTNTIYHNVSNFTCISAKDKMDVYLTQGSEFEVKVEAGANLQRLIKVELDGETLKVSNANRCNWVRGYKHKISIYITAPYFKHIKNAGLGTIASVGTITQDEISVRIENSGEVKLNLNTDKFYGSVHGNGDMYLAGTTKQIFSDFTGTNYLYASDLTITDYAYLHSVSIGPAYINAPENGLMDVIIDRSGNVYYTGNPSQINLTRNNKGNLIRD